MLSQSSCILTNITTIIWIATDGNLVDCLLEIEFGGVDNWVVLDWILIWYNTETITRRRTRRCKTACHIKNSQHPHRCHKHLPLEKQASSRPTKETLSFWWLYVSQTFQSISVSNPFPELTFSNSNKFLLNNFLQVEGKSWYHRHVSC